MIILMGLAGTGKSTQGRLLAAQLHCAWISTGGLLRQQMDQATQADMLQGKIIDDDKTINVLAEEFKRLDAAHNECILDGSPRTMVQAEWLARQAQAGHIRITAIIHLIADKAVARQRLLARQRPDDHEAAIAERFREYEEAVVPILNFLQQQGYIVHQVNAEQPAEVVKQDILKALEQPAHAA